MGLQVYESVCASMGTSAWEGCHEHLHAKSMDVYFQILQSIILERTKEGIMGLNSKGMTGRTVGRPSTRAQTGAQPGPLGLVPSERTAAPLGPGAGPCVFRSHRNTGSELIQITDPHFHTALIGWAGLGLTAAVILQIQAHRDPRWGPDPEQHRHQPCLCRGE